MASHGPRRALQRGDLLNAAQVRELIPLPRSTIYRLLGSAIPSFRVDGRIVVRRDDLERYLDRCQLESRGGAEVEPVPVDPDEILARVRDEAD